MKWINIKYELPTAGVEVLFITKEKLMYVGFMCSHFETFHYCSTGQEPNYIENATHWRLLPEAPH